MMRLITIPNQSSVPIAWKQFEDGRIKPSPLYNRIVDVMEELARFTLMTRGWSAMLPVFRADRKRSGRAQKVSG